MIETGYRPREVTTRLVKALKTLPVAVLPDPRQSGKSTLLQSEPAAAKGRAYRTLDGFATQAAAQSNPEALIDAAAILDEVQRCPELLSC